MVTVKTTAKRKETFSKTGTRINKANKQSPDYTLSKIKKNENLIKKGKIDKVSAGIFASYDISLLNYTVWRGLNGDPNKIFRLILQTIMYTTASLFDTLYQKNTLKKSQCNKYMCM